MHDHHFSPRKSMEQVWEDISLSSLYNHPTTAAAAAEPSGGGSTQPSANENASFCDSLGNMLSLNSGPDFHYLERSTDSIRLNPQLQSHDSSIIPPSLYSKNTPLNDLASCSSVFPSFGKKRVPEKDYNYSDLRHKRMMKNRESADRSRARKQAYTNELELKIAHLKTENARLRRQQETFGFATLVQLPKKHTLSRSSTAPF